MGSTLRPIEPKRNTAVRNVDAGCPKGNGVFAKSPTPGIILHHCPQFPAHKVASCSHRRFLTLKLMHCRLPAAIDCLIIVRYWLKVFRAPSWWFLSENPQFVSSNPEHRFSDGLYDCLIAAIAFAAVLLLQSLNGAFHHEFVFDAIGHYTTGLMLHDYVLSKSWSHPLAYAINYQEHYPFVGLGLWPPFYHALEGVWMLLFSPSRISVMVYSATLVALLASVGGWLLRRRFGMLAAITGVLVIAALPIMQFGANTLAVDTLVALLSLAAALSFAHYAATGRWLWSVVFAGLAAACILTKGNGFLLVLLPGLFVLLSGRWNMMSRWSFWLPLPIVGLLAGPWYLMTLGWIRNEFLYPWGWGYTRIALPANSQILLENLGPATVLAIVGAVAGVRAERAKGGALWTTMTALAIACFMFQAIVPAALEPRYLTATLVPLVVLCARGLAEAGDWIAGSQWVAKPNSPLNARTAVAALTLVLVLCALPGALHARRSISFGLGPIVEKAMAALPPQNPVLLLAGGPVTEDPLGGEVMLRENQRPHIVLARGTKVLGGGGYKRGEYKTRFDTAEAVMAEIERIGVPVVLLDVSSAAAEFSHNVQVLQAVKAYPKRWELVARSAPSQGIDLRVYRVLPNVDKTMDWSQLSAVLAPHNKFGN